MAESVSDDGHYHQDVFREDPLKPSENESKHCDGCVRSVMVNKPESSEHIGFNLTRSQWDPYPWVKSVDQDSAAAAAGLREGDCLLKVDGHDVVGLKISDVARLVRGSGRSVELLVWSNGPLADWNPEALFCGPLPGALGRLGSCVGGILRALECPVCVSTVRPPAAQCPRGHLFCAPCKAPLQVCPICRTSLSTPVRNLLADEVYNCVVEAFELQDKAKSKLTQNLFGDAKFIKTERNEGTTNYQQRPNREFPTNDAGHKWGTQRLLQRLLPGRARSTGNIARATRSPTRERILAEDRDLSRSLSTLDITRCRESSNRNESNSLNSLACTAGGSSTSLPPTNFHSSIRDMDVEVLRFIDDENFTDNEDGARNGREQRRSLFCPADPHCRDNITGDLHQHILRTHNMEVVLKPENSINMIPSSRKCCQALMYSGHWFYPKCERDESEGGVRVWCWTCEDNTVSSQYQLDVEVWSNDADEEEKEDRKIFKEYEACYELKRNLSIVDEMPEVQNDITEALEEIKNNTNKGKKIPRFIRRPLLKLAAPVLSLKNVSWSKVLNSRQSLFLGDTLLKDDTKIKISIDIID